MHTSYAVLDMVGPGKRAFVFDCGIGFLSEVPSERAEPGNSRTPDQVRFRCGRNSHDET
jgi:hypothetical protein